VNMTAEKKQRSAHWQGLTLFYRHSTTLTREEARPESKPAGGKTAAPSARRPATWWPAKSWLQARTRRVNSRVPVVDEAWLLALLTVNRPRSKPRFMLSGPLSFQGSASERGSKASTAKRQKNQPTSPTIMASLTFSFAMKTLPASGSHARMPLARAHLALPFALPLPGRGVPVARGVAGRLLDATASSSSRALTEGTATSSRRHPKPEVERARRARRNWRMRTVSRAGLTGPGVAISRAGDRIPGRQRPRSGWCRRFGLLHHFFLGIVFSGP